MALHGGSATIRRSGLRTRSTARPATVVIVPPMTSRRHDHLETPEAARDFLVSHDVPAPPDLPTAAQLARLRALRAWIRALASPDPPDPERWRLRGPRGVRRRPLPTRWRGPPQRGAGLGRGHRRPVARRPSTWPTGATGCGTCGNPRCRFLFVDRSRRGSRIWCEMAVCGNRMKVGRHRRGRALGPATPVQPPR